MGTEQILSRFIFMERFCIVLNPFLRYTILRGGTMQFSFGQIQFSGLACPWYLRGAVGGVDPAMWWEWLNSRYAVNQVPMTFDEAQTFSRDSAATGTSSAALVVGYLTDEERLEYSTGLRGLLIEENSTNYCLHSNEIHPDVRTPWGDDGTGTYTTGIGAPDGSTNAIRAESGSADLIIRQDLNAGSVTDKSWSVWLRTPTPFTTTIAIRDKYTWNNGAYEDVNVTTTWQRFTVSTDLVTTSGARVAIGGGGSLNSGKIIEMWGGQLEDLPFATSYIPTEGTAVERKADKNYTTFADVGIDASMIGTGATIYADYELTGNATDNCIFEIGADTANNRIVVDVGGGDLTVTMGGVVQATISGDVPTMGRHKIAVRFVVDNVAFYRDGTQVGGNTSCVLSAVPTKMYHGMYYTGLGQNSKVVYDERVYMAGLSYDECVKLTTL